MNRLTVRQVPPPYGPNMVIAWFIDDQPLADLLVADGCEWAEHSVLSLDGLILPQELAVAWAATVPDDGDVTLLPVTTCHSDRDFDCSCYAVEVGRLDGEVVWSRAGRPDGVDDGRITVPAWEPRFRGYRFTEENYLAVVAETRRLAAPEAELPDGHPGFRVGSRWRVTETFWTHPRSTPGQPGVPAGAVVRVVDALDWERPPWAWVVLEDGGAFLANEDWPDDVVPDDAAVFVSPWTAACLAPCDDAPPDGTPKAVHRETPE